MRRLRRPRSFEQGSQQQPATPAPHASARSCTPQPSPSSRRQPTMGNPGSPEDEDDSHTRGIETVKVLQSVAEMASGLVGLAGVKGLSEGLAAFAAGLQKVLDMKTNIKGVEKLKTRVTDLEANVMKIRSLPEDRQLPEERLEEIRKLAEKWSKIGKRADKIASRWKPMRFLTSKADATELEGLVAELSASIADSITMNGILSIEGYMAAFAEGLSNIQRTVGRLEDRLIGPVISKYARNAQFHCGETRQECLEGTRVEILGELDTWIDTSLEHNNGALYWINGNPGTGKTAIACTVAQKCKNKNILAANFFCSRSDAECSDAALIFPTIARQMGRFHLPFGTQLEGVLREDPDIEDARLPEQFEKLIVLPLEAAKDFPKSVVIFDALDECKSKEAAQTILSTIARFIHRIGQHVSFIVTSRPEPGITDIFGRDSLKAVTTTLVLHDVPQDQVLADLKRYVKHEFENRVGSFIPDRSWPSEEQKDGLVNQSEGLFVYVKTAIDFILDEAYGDPPGQFQSLLPAPGQPRSPESGEFLYALYTRIVVASHDKTKQMKPKLVNNLRNILGIIAVAQDALSTVALARFLSLDENTVRFILLGLHSVLAIPPNNRQPIRTLHSTFPDFLLQSPPDVAPNSGTSPPVPMPIEFHVQSGKQHWEVFSRCLTAVRTLRRDMIGIKHPARFKNEIPDFEKRVEDAIEPHVQYACRYWVTHLLQGLDSATTDTWESLLIFLKQYLLPWFEACNLLGITDKIIPILAAPRKSLQTIEEPLPEIVSLLADALRFALTFLPCIHAAPLAVYYSALSLTPTNSTVRPYFEKPDNALVVMHGISSHWEPCIAEFSVPDDNYPNCVTFHPDGSSFAAGVHDRVIIWNAYTRNTIQSISACPLLYSVYSLAFSPDGSHLALGMDSSTISIFQVSSGECIHSWTTGDESYAVTVAYSANGDRLLSTGEEGWRLWDTIDWSCLVHLKVKIFNRAAISPNGQTIAYGSHGRTNLYDVSSKQVTKVLGIPTDDAVVMHAFSLNGDHVAAVSGNTIRVWKHSNMSLIRSVPLPDAAHCVAFSPDGLYIACGLSSGTIILVGVTSQEPRRIFEESEAPISDLAWSLDGIFIVSVSLTKITPLMSRLRAWDVTQRYQSTTTNEHILSNEHIPAHPLHFAHVEYLRGNADLQFEILLYLPSLGVDAENFVIGPQMPDGAPTVTLTGENISVLGSDHRHSDWEYITGKFFTGSSYYTCNTAISPDGLLMAYPNTTSWDVIVCRIRDGTIVSTLPNHTTRVDSIVFSPDAARIGTCSRDGELIVWEVATGNVILDRNTSSFMGGANIAFSSDSSLIACGQKSSYLWRVPTILLLDITARSIVEILQTASDSRGLGLYRSTAMFVDGDKHLLVLERGCGGYVFDVATGAPLHSFGHTNDSLIDSVSFSRDDTGIEFTDDAGAAGKLALWRPGSRLWPTYSITQGGWVTAARPGRKERLCWVPSEWHDTLGWSGETVCSFKEKQTGTDRGHPVLGKDIVLDFGPLLDAVGFWED